MKTSGKLFVISLLVFFAILSFAAPVPRSYGANPFVVQSTAANTLGTISNSGTTSTITVTAGDSLIIVAGFASGNTQNTNLQCSDNLAQTYTTLIQQNQWVNFGHAQASIICYKQNSVGGSDAFTVTASTVAQGLIVIAGYEVIPALNLTDAVSSFCKQPFGSNACHVQGIPGYFCGGASQSWDLGVTNASLVLSVMGGTPAGTDDNFTGTGFDRIVQRNIVAGTNSSQMIAEGNGSYSDSCLPPTGASFSGVMAAFGPFTSPIVSTVTQTEINAPQTNAFSGWGIELIMNLVFGFSFVLIPVALNEKNPFLYSFLFFIGMTLGGIFGLFINNTVWADPAVFGFLTVLTLISRKLS